MRDALGDSQSILVFGGTSDIARATCAALETRRTTTVLTAGRHDCDYEFDALDRESHGPLVERIWSEHPDIDVVLFAWGVLQGGPEIVDVNLTGAVTLATAVAERVRAQGHGTIVALSSVAAYRGRRSNYLYAASKAGFDAYFQGLGHELAGTGARVMIVRPGFVRTKMTDGLDPAPFATTPERVADAIVDGLRRGREVVWVPPILQPVMNVLRLLPSTVYRRLPS